MTHNKNNVKSIRFTVSLTETKVKKSTGLAGRVCSTCAWVGVKCENALQYYTSVHHCAVKYISNITLRSVKTATYRNVHTLLLQMQWL